MLANMLAGKEKLWRAFWYFYVPALATPIALYYLPITIQPIYKLALYPLTISVILSIQVLALIALYACKKNVTYKITPCLITIIVCIFHIIPYAYGVILLAELIFTFCDKTSC